MSASRKGGSASTGREVEDQLRQLTKRFEQVLEISPTAIVFTDLANRIASWNPAAERLFGYSAEEAAGRDLDDLVASTDALHAEAVQFRQRVAASEHVRTISRRTRKDGSFVDVELLAAPLVVDGQPVGTFAIYHDITELNRQRRFLEALLEVSPEAIVTTDLDDTVTSWNPSAERLFGYTAEEAIGHDIDELVSRRADLYAEGKELNRGAHGIPDGPPGHPANQEGWIARRRRHRGRSGHRRRRARGEARLLSRHQRAPRTEALLRVAPRDQPDGHRRSPTSSRRSSRGTPPPRGSSVPGRGGRWPRPRRPRRRLGRSSTTKRWGTARPRHVASGSRPSPSGPGRTDPSSTSRSSS